MTDPLGQSQVLPYIIGLTNEGYNFTLISCEKKERYIQNKAIINKICQENNIDWQPIFYTKKPPILSTVWDIIKLNRKVKKIHKNKKFSLIHCRSYITSLIGLGFKKKHNVSFIFDMRGFWADERVDGKIWDISKYHYKIVYNYFKKKEREFLEKSDSIISLTNAGKNEILKWNINNLKEEKIKVIPCVADYNHFNIVSEETRNKIKQKFGVNKTTKVVSYVGSLGTWYLADEMIAFYNQILKKYNDFIFLILTPDSPNIIKDIAKKYNIDSRHFMVKFISRKELPNIVSISDFSMFFIKNSYSKMSSSPTKMGELLALGIPVVCNSIGDVKHIVENTSSGICLEELNEKTYIKTVEKLPCLFENRRFQIRENSKKYFLLDNGIKLYLHIYKNIL